MTALIYYDNFGLRILSPPKDYFARSGRSSLPKTEKFRVTDKLQRGIGDSAPVHRSYVACHACTRPTIRQSMTEDTTTISSAEAINMGIAPIVPAHKIKEIISQEGIIDMMKKHTDEIISKNQKGAVFDSP
jgi:hypothetical protein